MIAGLLWIRAFEGSRWGGGRVQSASKLWDLNRVSWPRGRRLELARPTDELERRVAGGGRGSQECCLAEIPAGSALGSEWQTHSPARASKDTLA